MDIEYIKVMIHYYRLKKNISKQELGMLIDRSTYIVRRLEKSKIKVIPIVFFKIATILDISEEDIKDYCKVFYKEEIVEILEEKDCPRILKYFTIVAGFTRKELSELSSITQASLIRYENNIKSMPLVYKLKIIEILNISEKDLHYFDMKRIKSKLQYFRERRGVSRAELARRLNIDKNALKRYESEHKLFPYAKLVNLKSSLELTDEELQCIETTEEISLLKQLRIKYGIQLKDIANEVGISKNKFIDYERLNARRIPRQVIEDIQNVMKLSLEDYNNLVESESLKCNNEGYFRYYRERACLSQLNLSVLLGVSIQVTNYYESGQLNLGESTFENIAKVFKLSKAEENKLKGDLIIKKNRRVKE